MIAKILQTNTIESLEKLTTKDGYAQISTDFQKSINDPRIKLLVFDSKHIQSIIPIKIHFTRDINGIGFYIFCNNGDEI